MKLVTQMKKTARCYGLYLLLSACLASPALAGVFATMDLSQGNANLSQWDGIANAYLNNTNSGNPIAINYVQMANDSNYLYLRIHFFASVNPNDGSAASGQVLYTALDNDSNASTGFNVYGIGTVGSEVGWDNFGNAFQQAAGNFNTGATLTNASQGVTAYWSSTQDQQIRIALNATIDTTGTPLVFANNSFSIAFYGNDTADPYSAPYDFTGPIAYMIIPEPQVGGLLAACAIGVGILSHFRRRVS